MARPKIFCLFSNKGRLSAKGGDSINETRFYRVLSCFADVYYNDELIDWDADTFGKDPDPKMPTRDYDLYYIRANHEFFLKLPSPKFTMAYPYDDEVYKEADGIFTTTDIWIQLIEDLNKSQNAQKILSTWFPSKIIEPKLMINIEQSCDPRFEGFDFKKSKLLEYRALTTGAKVIGLYGRITDDTLPWDAMDHINNLRKRMRSPADPLFALAGSLRIPCPSGAIYFGSVPYLEMPYLFSVTAAAIGGTGEAGVYLGSTKILDAMQQGVPILQKRRLARIEQLGENYLGFYDTSSELDSLIEKIVFDEGFRKALSDDLLDRRLLFLPAAAAKRVLSRLQAAGLLKGAFVE